MSKIRRRRRSVNRRKAVHKTWQLQEAKARFSELVNEVMEDGYHTITKNGQPVVVIISHEEFEKFKKPTKTLGQFLAESPFSKYDLDIKRDKSPGKDIDL
jgi:antitoxin Phd